MFRATLFNFIQTCSPTLSHKRSFLFTEVEMTKIYISSTFSDLKECREAVYKALRALRHDVIAMEDYVASDQRPLDKCLADVVASDIYVGIFAYRYGFKP